MSAVVKIRQEEKASEGLSHEEFMAISGLAPLPPIPVDAVAKLPVQYETAVRLLAQCETIDDARQWSIKSDALAAWASIYKNDEAGVQARKLKLHAFRRMGILAGELRPQRALGMGKGKVGLGTSSGPYSLLIESGLSKTQAGQIRCLALLPKAEFDSLIDQEIPPTPNKFQQGPPSEYSSMRKAMRELRSKIDRSDLRAIGNSLTPSQANNLRKLVTEIIESLTDFRDCIPVVVGTVNSSNEMDG